MNRTPVNSSNMHSIGWDETGQEVQYHAKDCAGRKKPQKRDGHGDPELMPGCDCNGGEVWHYPGVPAEVHLRVINAPSVGSAFHDHVKSARNPSTRELLYPGVKR